MRMGMGVEGIKSCSMGNWEQDKNGNEVNEMGGIWYEKSVPVHLYLIGVISKPPPLKMHPWS